MEEPVIEDGQIVKGGMWSHQSILWESDERIKALIGGYGSGKSMTAIKRGIWLALKNNGIPGMIVSPNNEQARKTIVTDMIRVLDGRGIEYIYKEQKKEFTIKYKGRTGLIWIASGDKPESLKGPNLAWAIIDEPFIQKREVFDQMIARIRHPKAVYKELLLTGTPEDMGWGYDVLEGDERSRFKSMLVVRAKTSDNLALSEEDRQLLWDSMDETRRKAYFNGEFTDLSSSPIYYAFNDDNNVERFSVPKGAELSVGMDFNVNPMSAVVFYHEQNRIYVVDEIKLKNANTEVMADEIRKKVAQYAPWQESRVVVYPDPTGKNRKTSAPIGVTDFTILKQEGFIVRAPNAAPTNRDSYNNANKNLELRNIIVHPRCKQLIKDYKRLSYSKTLGQQQDYTHMSDALKYAINYIMPIKMTIDYSKTRYYND